MLVSDLAVWREEVLARDNHTCQECVAVNHLHAHHVKSRAEHPDLVLEVDNGLTLCKKCHDSVHGMTPLERRPGIMRRVNFYFPGQMLTRLKKASDSLDIPMSELIRRAIDKLLSEMGVL